MVGKKQQPVFRLYHMGQMGLCENMVPPKIHCLVIFPFKPDQLGIYFHYETDLKHPRTTLLAISSPILQYCYIPKKYT